MTERERQAIATLRSPWEIRRRCGRILAAGVAGRLSHFDVALDRIPALAAWVARIVRDSYPSLAIPIHSRWPHFAVGGVDRLAPLRGEPGAEGTKEIARRYIDLAVVSILLDAGSGPLWRYRDGQTGMTLARSEGLAVASLAMFMAGFFSTGKAMRGDAARLAAVTEDELKEALQVGEANPIEGLAGRAGLLRALGAALAASPHIFAPEARPGGLLDYLLPRARGRRLAAATILAAILEGLAPIWPPHIAIAGVPLGDVGRHREAGGQGCDAGLVPLHKLSQWLGYSLVQPLEMVGLEVTELEALTGLAEYRNGGLFVDRGVLIPKHADVTGRPHAAHSEVIVEWRALTVALLEELASELRALLGLAAADLPMARVLEGGTWRAGRMAAREARADGSPPLAIISDGTVF